MSANRKYLEVILKTSERCNLACKYCYFFYGGDESYKKHPPLIKIDTIRDLSNFLSQGVDDLQFTGIQIDFHGGEPTLQRKQDFDEMCSILKAGLSSKVDLSFAIQTNATLINEKWIDLFEKYQVHVGVSLDGPSDVNDLARIDHRGRGSYSKVKRGIDFLKEAAEKKRISSPALLCVINPDHDPDKIYNHFVHELGFTYLDFLLPDFNHMNPPPYKTETYGKYLCLLFDCWTQDDNPKIRLRILISALKILTGSRSELMGFGGVDPNSFAVTISSNGEISPDDTLRTADPNLMGKYTIKNSTLKNFFSSPLLQEIQEAEKKIPNACSTCCWEHACQGGMLVHRFGKKNRFNNPSVYCDDLKLLYGKISRYLVKNGYSKERIAQALKIVA